MLDLRFARLWQMAGAILLLFTLVAAVAPELPFWKDDSGPSFEHADKVMHALTFTILTLYFSGQYRQRSYWRIAIGLFAFGVLIEVLQSFLDYRIADGADIVADVAGIAVGLGIAIAGVGGWSTRAEQWWIAAHA